MEKKEETIALNSAIINKETIAMVVSNSLALAKNGEKSLRKKRLPMPLTR